MTMSTQELRRTERFFAAKEVAPEAAVVKKQEGTEPRALLTQATLRLSSSTWHTRTPGRRMSDLGAGLARGYK